MWLTLLCVAGYTAAGGELQPTFEAASPGNDLRPQNEASTLSTVKAVGSCHHMTH